MDIHTVHSGGTETDRKLGYLRHQLHRLGVRESYINSMLPGDANPIALAVAAYYRGKLLAQESLSLTVTGKEERRQEIASATSKKIAEEKQKTLPGLNRNISQIESSLQAKPAIDGGDGATLSFFREKEIRDALRANKGYAVKRLYLAATKDGNDPLLEAAVENAPKFAPLVEAKDLEEGRANRMVRQNPEAAQNLRELRMVRDAYEYLVETALGELAIPQTPEEIDQKRRLLNSARPATD